MRTRFCLLSLLFLFAVSADAQQERLNPAEVSAKWFRHTSIVWNYSYPDSASFMAERDSGHQWVFEYIFRAKEDPHVADDEFMEVVSFQVPAQRKRSFLLKDSQLLQAKAYYLQGCFCPGRGFMPISKGTISGRRLRTNVWLLDIRVQVNGQNGSFPKEVRRKFYLEKKD